MTRQDDAVRPTSHWSQWVKEGKLRGELSLDPTDEEVYAFARSAWTPAAPYDPKELPTKFFGDDLTAEDLDQLWRAFTQGETDSLLAGWWADKPHQVAYRLLLRLTRAEAEVAELRSELDALRVKEPTSS